MSKELNALLAPDRPLKALLITQQGFFHRQGWRHSFASLPVTYNFGMWCGGLALIVVLQHTAFATTTGSGPSTRQTGVDATHRCTVMMAACAKIPPFPLSWSHRSTHRCSVRGASQLVAMWMVQRLSCTA